MLEEHAHTHECASTLKRVAARGLVWMLEEHAATRSTVQLSALLATYALSDVVSATCAGGRAAGGLCAG